MINFDDYGKWPYIPDHPFRICWGSGKTNALLNLIEKQPDTDKTYLYVKDSYEGKYQSLINMKESIGLNLFNDFKGFIEYSNDMLDVYKNIDEYNVDEFNIEYSNDMQDVYKDIDDMQDVYKDIDECNADKKQKILIVFDDMIDDMINKRLNSTVTELFIRCIKLNISLVFITQSYCNVSKDVKLNSTHFFIMKFLNKRELQQIH